ncbi:MAG: sulfotransferase [Balneolaceae bacterium]|nr:sulfotransferase [Balneolaceae bacterium]
MQSRPHPIKVISDLISRHDALRPGNFGLIAAIYVKLLIEEPFRIVENRNHQKAIEEHRLDEDPVFVIGHWRSGTSFLQYLIGQDPQFGYLSKFQAVFPAVFLSFEEGFKRWFSRFFRVFNLTEDADNMSINLQLDSPSELDIALTTLFSAASPHWGHIFPQEGWSYFNKYFFFDEATEKEIRRWKRDYDYLIRKTSVNNGGKQLVLKSPGNTVRMEKLLELYPKARFIFIYRNPYDVFYSNKKLWNLLRDNLAMQPLSDRAMQRQILVMYEKMMRRYLELRPQVPEGQLAELRFEEFVEDPVERMRSVYSQLNLSGFEQAESPMSEFIANRSQQSAGSYSYEPAVVEKINSMWKFAFDEWNYPMIEQRSTATASEQPTG